MCLHVVKTFFIELICAPPIPHPLTAAFVKYDSSEVGYVSLDNLSPALLSRVSFVGRSDCPSPQPPLAPSSPTFPAHEQHPYTNVHGTGMLTRNLSHCISTFATPPRHRPPQQEGSGPPRTCLPFRYVLYGTTRLSVPLVCIAVHTAPHLQLLLIFELFEHAHTVTVLLPSLTPNVFCCASSLLYDGTICHHIDGETRDTLQLKPDGARLLDILKEHDMYLTNVMSLKMFKIGVQELAARQLLIPNGGFVANTARLDCLRTVACAEGHLTVHASARVCVRACVRANVDAILLTLMTLAFLRCIHQVCRGC